MLSSRLPAYDLFRSVVFRVAVRHSVLMGNIKDGEFAPFIVHGGNPLRLPRHDRVFAFDNSPDLTQHLDKFGPWIQRR